MEWGLRKVLPKTSKEKRVAFALQIVPVIAELCSREMTEEERRTFLDELVHKIWNPPAPSGEDSGCSK